MNSREIKEIQTILNDLAYTDSRLAPVFVNGVYSRQTKRAVTIFQRLYGLDPSGEVDNNTWDELQAQANDLKGVEPQPLYIFPDSNFVLHPDDTHEVALAAAFIINRLADEYQNIQSVPIQTHYNMQTAEEIRTIQELHRIEPSGNIDSKTWNVLVTLYENRLSHALR